jgi:hypothetical protein
MRTISLLSALIIFIISCGDNIFLKNQTRPGGYAMGERIELRFSSTRVENPPDSLDVVVIEEKTKFRYEARAGLRGCEQTCEYAMTWDGRKPDASWPSGGRYRVYASWNEKVYSDTVQFGLAD